MKQIVFATKFVAVMLSLTLLAVPALAEQADQENFHALSGITTDEQAANVLTDEQLATVEGGFHLTAAQALLNLAISHVFSGFLNDANSTQLLIAYILSSYGAHAVGPVYQTP
jgi:hypothetical protein